MNRLRSCGGTWFGKLASSWKVMVRTPDLGTRTLYVRPSLGRAVSNEIAPTWTLINGKISRTAVPLATKVKVPAWHTRSLSTLLDVKATVLLRTVCPLPFSQRTGGVGTQIPSETCVGHVATDRFRVDNKPAKAAGRHNQSNMNKERLRLFNVDSPNQLDQCRFHEQPGTLFDELQMKQIMPMRECHQIKLVPAVLKIYHSTVNNV
ncbi:hypothetical protein ACVWZX_005284 [Deinococcus sp. UYEF24]